MDFSHAVNTRPQTPLSTLPDTTSTIETQSQHIPPSPPIINHLHQPIPHSGLHTPTHPILAKQEIFHLQHNFTRHTLPKPHRPA